MNMSCPACGAEVRFKARTSAFAVCAFCQSMLVRQDLDLENIGKMAELPPDLSPFQIGSSGIFKAEKFELIGRQRVHWKNGSWNEWYLSFIEGGVGWLAEAQGFLMISRPAPEQSPPALELCYPGASFLIDGGLFQVQDSKEVTLLGSEGELPSRGEKGRQFTSVDFVGDGDRFASIEYGEEKATVYLGVFVEIEDLRMTHLRSLDGW
jgi:hypothetical protein